MAQTLETIRWWKRSEGADGDAAGVRLETVWLNHVGIVAVMSLKGSKPPNDDETKQSVAALLRVVADAARQLRRSGPLLGILVPTDAAADDFDKKVTRLARDQEWHRGDFILRYAPNHADAEDMAEEVLFPFERVRELQIAVDKGEQVYFDALRERLGTSGASEHAKELLNAVIGGREAAAASIEAFQKDALAMITERAEAAVARKEEEADNDE